MHKFLRIHPEFKNLIPPPSPEEYTQLEQNILAQGCRDPIAHWRGIIVDGHNRHSICTKHGLPYETVKLRFPSRDAAKIWVLENQLGRRNLTDAIRIELATLKVKLSGRTISVRRHIAREAKVSEQKVQRYMSIKTHGDPDLVNKVMTGDMKIGTAHRLSNPRRHMTVTTKTVEDMGTVVQTIPEMWFYRARSVVNNTRHIENMLLHLKRHMLYSKGMKLDVPARLGGYLLRLVGVRNKHMNG